MLENRETRAAAVGIAVWALVVGGGFYELLRYKATPGAAAAAPARWPVGSAIARATDRATLVMFVHPRCTCSRASLHELSRLAARFPERLATRIVVARAPSTGGLLESDTTVSARSVLGATIIEDDGTEARRFGVATSGDTVLYDADGALRFHGGITASRGHEGPSFGQARIAALLTDGKSDRADSPAFGCPLARSDEPLSRKDNP